MSYNDDEIKAILDEIKRLELARQLAKGLHPNIDTKIMWDDEIDKLRKKLEELTRK